MTNIIRRRAICKYVGLHVRVIYNAAHMFVMFVRAQMYGTDAAKVHQLPLLGHLWSQHLLHTELTIAARSMLACSLSD